MAARVPDTRAWIIATGLARDDEAEKTLPNAASGARGDEEGSSRVRHHLVGSLGGARKPGASTGLALDETMMGVDHETLKKIFLTPMGGRSGTLLVSTVAILVGRQFHDTVEELRVIGAIDDADPRTRLLPWSPSPMRRLDANTALRQSYQFLEESFRALKGVSVELDIEMARRFRMIGFPADRDRRPIRRVMLERIAAASETLGLGLAVERPGDPHAFRLLAMAAGCVEHALTCDRPDGAAPRIPTHRPGSARPN